MNPLKNRIVQSLLLATFLSFNGCALFTSKIKVEIPPRPDYEECEDKPDIRGKVQDNTVILALPDAVRLREWVNGYIVCTESNAARADGHIEKLENRLKAIGG